MNTLLNHFNQVIKRNGVACKINNSNDADGIFREIDDKDKSIDTKYFYTIEKLNQGDIIYDGNYT